jgi:deoxyribonuclease I
MRGFLARTTLYHYGKYDLRLSGQDRRVYEAWSRLHPVSEWERWRNRRVACAMGDGGNPLVGPVEPCSSGFVDAVDTSRKLDRRTRVTSARYSFLP